MATELALAPGASVRVIDGYVMIFASSTACPVCPLEKCSAEFVAFLSSLSRPRNVDAALVTFHPAIRNVAIEAIERLVSNGALVKMHPSQAVLRENHEMLTRARRFMRSLSADICEVACELSGLGPYAEQQIVERSGVGVESRLIAVRDDIHALLELLRSLSCYRFR